MTAALHNVGWPVHTSRLVIRPVTEDDEKAIWSFRQLDESSMWLTTHYRDREAFRASFDDPAERADTLVIDLDGTVIGTLLVRVEDPWAQTEVRAQADGTQAEIGWVLHPDRTGQGYASEAVEGLFDICFDRLGLRRVVATDRRAQRSRVKDLGAERLTKMRQSAPRSRDAGKETPAQSLDPGALCLND